MAVYLVFLSSLLPRMYRQGDITIQLLSSLTESVFSIWDFGPVNRMDVPAFISDSTFMQCM